MCNQCGCCQGVEQVTPLNIFNRPGQDRLGYRMGTHATFMDSMLAALSTTSQPDKQGLEGLRTRRRDDPSIALLDAWATVADVLTFYTERIANEGYLRTATERRSILELSRLVGYRLRPGVAASTLLAFQIEANGPGFAEIAAGARVQSVPGPDEEPQTFETTEPLHARARWNNLGPRLALPQTKDSIENKRVLIDFDDNTAPKYYFLYLQATSLRPQGQFPRVYLQGVNTNLNPNDMLLIAFGRLDPKPYRVTKVTPDPDAVRTLVHLDYWARSQSLSANPSKFTDIDSNTVLKIKRQASEDFDFYQVTSVSEDPNGGTTRLLLSQPATGAPATAIRAVLARSSEDAMINDGDLRTGEYLTRGEQTNPPTAASPENQITVYAMRVKAPLFGHNAQKRVKLEQNETETVTVPIGEWPIACSNNNKPASTEFEHAIFLDAVYKSILPDSYVVVDMQAVEGQRDAAAVAAVKEVLTNQEGLGDTDEKVKAIITSVLEALAPKLESAPPRETDAIIEHVLRETLSSIVNEGDLMEAIVAGAVEMVQAALKAQVTPKEEIVNTKAISVQADIARAEYGLTGKSTRIQLQAEWIKIKAMVPCSDGSDDNPIYDEDFKVIRYTTVYAQSEELLLAQAPVEQPICGQEIKLDGFYGDMEPGRRLILTGASAKAGEEGTLYTEPVTLAELVHNTSFTYTRLKLLEPLARCYIPETVTIYGNVARANHGEAQTETLGNGDGSRPHQTFALKKPPLTHIAAVTPTGEASTLEVFVNDVQWTEADNMAQMGPRAREFITHTDDNGNTSVIFGNGERGAHLPTGLENVRARYRSGIGAAGNVDAGQLTNLLTRPLGVTGVTNLLPATGGADRDSRDQARERVPIALLALDRFVSVADYAGFALAFAGIGKASATEISDGRRHLVHVTIAGADDVPIDPTSDLYHALHEAMLEFGDPFQPFILAVRELLLIKMEARVALHPAYRWNTVEEKVRTAVLDTLSFERSELGQDVIRSQVIAAMQHVEGVAYVDIDEFYTEDRNKRTIPESPPLNSDRLPVQPARLEPAADDSGRVLPRKVIRAAQLAYMSAGIETLLTLHEIKG